MTYRTNLRALFVLCLTLPTIAAANADDRPFTVKVRASAIDSFSIRKPFRSTFGAFEFVGGLELEASIRHFGSFSGLDFVGDTLYAVTDTGFWLRATLKADADGRPLALTNAMMAPIRDTRGIAVPGKHNMDAEAVLLRGEGRKLEAIVAFERIHAIRRYALGREGLAASAADIPVPRDFENLRYNKGVEAIAPLPELGENAFVAFAERTSRRSHESPAFQIAGAVSRRFALRRRDGFDPTDAKTLPNGDVLLLERRISIGAGVAMRLRVLPAKALSESETVDGPVVLDAGPTHMIDNMEGLALTRDRSGHLLVTLISDNNQSILQRTLLLRFRVDEKALAGITRQFHDRSPQ